MADESEVEVLSDAKRIIIEAQHGFGVCFTMNNYCVSQDVKGELIADGWYGSRFDGAVLGMIRKIANKKIQRKAASAKGITLDDIYAIMVDIKKMVTGLTEHDIKTRK
jgi:hypothetical protein